MSKKGFTLIEVMVVVAIVGILASIAIPSVVRFQSRAKQAEAKANLKALFTAQKSWYGERDAYITDGSMLGFAPELNNRYAYDLGGTDCWARPGLGGAAYNCVTNDTQRYPPLMRPSNLFPLLPMMIGVSGTCPQCQFAGSAAGNIDNDQQFDEWFVSSVDGTSIGWGGGCGPEMAFPTAGVPFNAQNDVSCDPP